MSPTATAPVEGPSPARPRFSVVSAVYNVAEYIEAFLSSLDRQTYGIENLEIILVDDGSTDGAGEIARRWAESTPARVHVIRQENAGQGAARNAGIELATGEWVTFADPDDVLADDYFSEVAAFLGTQRKTPDLLATRLLVFTDDPAAHVDKHALRKNFGRGNQLVDMSQYPNRIHLSAGTAFLPLDRLRANGNRFDPRIRPTFEDGHLIGVHLLESAAPLVGFIASAGYYYRKRADGTSSVQSAWTRDDKYLAVPRYGYLDLLRRGAQRYGRPPVWLQNTVLYDLLWYFKADSRLISATGAVRPEVQDEFHALCREIFALIDVETIMGFQVSSTAYWLRNALVVGYKDLRTRPSQVRLDQLDERQRLVRARYTYGGPRPREEFSWRGRQVEPVHQKVRSIEFFGRAVAQERIVWLPADGTLRITLDGRPVPLSTRAPSDLPYQVTALRLSKELGASRPDLASGPDVGATGLVRVVGAPARWLSALVTWFAAWVDREQWTARITRRRAAGPSARRRYADAWVLMDRQEQAQDSAEHLYRYLKRKRPQVNAWFVLDRQSPDWRRLQREGFKLVAHGSVQWRMLLLNARHVVSSHANAFAMAPLPHALYGRPQWQFTFLQHGVGKDDYSRWLNDKRISLLMTTTEAEERSFTGDGTPYVFTTKEVKRTGLPRHDALLAKARKLADRDVDRILVMPTWRRSLAEGMPESLTPEERAAAFRASEYAQHWFGLLQAPELRQVAERTGSRVAFLPHPNMTPFLHDSDVPGHVELLRWADVDVQDVFARTALLITDYSSIAFEVALLGRPTVYFQFDRDEFFSGAQPYRRGYFSYERDGFGPVTTSLEEAVSALEKLAVEGLRPDEAIERRIRATFGEPAGDACYQVFKAIRELDRPVRAQVVAGPSGVEVAAGDAAAVVEGPGTPTTEGLAPGDGLTGAQLVEDALNDAALHEPELADEGLSEDFEAVGADGVTVGADQL
ncbi:Glycosyltransferase involved in cell wall bisynthesis [Geodermatophilus obscurus]|uniref:Glycosyltransferase involved in cell wall bisynthesis n=1 Tax=Geodermatophilus obscurus TaxID=1861 RepID=A0A1I5FAN4_9ACTN|nr:CDP-glycerol glycerophosphotransferase family protein [Geodermatophilus obscurus]SFO20381.1 Glycosyltransferase involved in cell wall bisynthesis [Geodermatophilus obscurus]